VVGLVSTAAADQGTRAYDAYGGVLGTTGTQGTLGYQGDITDQVTGQVDMGTRWYQPSTGRFTTRDVLFGEIASPMSLNQFAYGAMNPITMWDPTGMRVALHRGGGYCGRWCMDAEDTFCADQGIDCSGYSPAPVPPTPAPPIDYDPGEFRTWINERRTWIEEAAGTFGVPASVIAGTLAVEHGLDARSRTDEVGEYLLGAFCGLPLIGRHGKCDTLSIGAGQVQLRRAELLSPGANRDELVALLSDDRMNIHYVAGYLSLLRSTHAPGTSWPTIYGTATDPSIGEYNADPNFVGAFAVSIDYYAYLDSE
jgi:RHS repeat-associated protein